MAYAQSAKAGVVTYPAALAYPSNVVVGNLLVALIQNLGSANDDLTISDTQRNVWTQISYASGGATSRSVFCYAVAKASGPNTVSTTFDTHAAGQLQIIAEYSGVSLLDQSSGGGAGTKSITTTKAVSDVIAVTTGVAAGTIAAGSGYTLRQSIQSGYSQGLEDRSVVSTGTYSALFANPPDSTLIVNFYAPTHSISGSAGVAGATVSWTGTASGSTTADGSGNYTIPSLADGSYTVIASKTGYTFTGPTPANAQVVSGANLTGVNFVATQILVATPTLSPNGGTFASGPVVVTVTDTDSALTGFAMYYTTDGTTPTTGSTPYTVPISLSVTTTLKVLAVATGYANSAIASATYRIRTGGHRNRSK